MWRPLAVLLSSSLLMSGCASLGQRDCLKRAWAEAGYTDALAGQAETHFNAQQARCESAGVAIPKSEYYAGYRRGLVTYCNAERLFQLGEQGQGFPAQCHWVDEAPVQAYFTEGAQVHEVLRAKTELEQQSRALQAKLQAPDADAVVRQAIYAQLSAINTRIVSLQAYSVNLRERFKAMAQTPAQPTR